MSIKIINLTKCHQQQTILENITLEIKNNLPLFIMGTSGCGKTTLLSIIFGSQKATSGKLLINGEDITLKSIYDRNVKFVNQNPLLFEYMNVKENIKFGFKDCCNLSEKEKNDKIESLAKELGIESILNNNIESISDGQKQRITIARAIIQTPDVLIMDEPFNKIDEFQKEQSMSYIKNLALKYNIKLIVATHSLEEAEFFNGYLGIIEDKILKNFDHVKNIIDNPKNKLIAKLLKFNEQKVTNVKINDKNITFCIGDKIISVDKSITFTDIISECESATIYIDPENITILPKGDSLIFKTLEISNRGKNKYIKVSYVDNPQWCLKLKVLSTFQYDIFSIKINKILILK